MYSTATPTTATPTSSPTGNPTLPRYLLGRNGTGYCVDGYRNVLQLAQCQAAANELGIKNVSYRPEVKTSPKGCFVMGNLVTFNNASASGSIGVTKVYAPVCGRTQTVLPTSSPTAAPTVSGQTTTPTTSSPTRVWLLQNDTFCPDRFDKTFSNYSVARVRLPATVLHAPLCSASN